MGDNNKHNTLTLSLTSFTLAALAATLVVIGLSAFILHGMWVSDVTREQTRQLSKTEAQQRAAAVALYLSEQQSHLNRLAERPSIAKLVQGSSSSLIATVSASMKAAFPKADSMRLLSLDRIERISGEQGEFSFTELDMINRAEQRRGAVAPELLKKDDWKLLFIASVIDQAQPKPVGTLLMSQPASGLFETLAKIRPEQGQTLLLRRTRTEPFVVYRTPQSYQGDYIEVSVENSEWLIRFTPSPALVDDATASPLLLIVIHLFAALLLLPSVYWLMGKVDPARKAQPQTLTAAPAKAAHSLHDTHDLLDVQVAEEDSDVLDLQETSAIQVDEIDSEEEARSQVPESIFRAYDIRGLANDQITPDLAMRIGQAIASEALSAGESCLYVGRDGRVSSPELSEALIQGVLSTGCDVMDLGTIPTPLMYFATCEFPESNSGIMVTASHNPAEYNGFKMVIDGTTLADDQVLQIKSRVVRGDYYQGSGERVEASVIPEYIDRIFSDVALAGDVKLVIDAANGVTAGVAPQLFEELGCEVVPLFCELDGTFPNHNPDPTREENLQALIQEVQTSGSDLGVAFDGDGDRLVVVTPSGKIIWPDRLLMLFAKDIVSRNPGADVLYDVKCTRELTSIVSSYGGRPIMWKTGHSHLKAKMQETGALVGGELSGHIFIKDRWYGFDDGMYATARLLEIMTLRDQDIDSLFDSFPTLPSTPEILVPVAEEEKFKIIKNLIDRGDFQNGKPVTLDGLRVEFAKGWGLVRASNTSAALTLRFEAEDEQVIGQMQMLFKRELTKVAPDIQLPF
ncbi:MAG: phosphomannomutase/phosphoglucomutase [Candidatus Pelagadaptatus aseana]|uniref:phosphomannomutase/phosphoglucomutase n=1 Tax=Candidatus Pelagadaptatus aseana TaxID=3120508 RepID=UPI0039B260D9